MDFKREKSHKSKTTKEIVLTQEDKAKYTKLYDFLLQDNDDEKIPDDGGYKVKSKIQSSMEFRVNVNDESFNEVVEKYINNNVNIDNNEIKQDTEFK